MIFRSGLLVTLIQGTLEVTLLDDTFVIIFYHFMNALFASGSSTAQQINWLSVCYVEVNVARGTSWDGSLHCDSQTSDVL